MQPPRSAGPADRTVPAATAAAAVAVFCGQVMAEAAGALDCDDAQALAELLRSLGDPVAASLFADQHRDVCRDHPW